MRSTPTLPPPSAPPAPPPHTPAAVAIQLPQLDRVEALLRDVLRRLDERDAPTSTERPDDRLSEPQAAALIGRTRKTLRNWRSSGLGGPPHHKDGGRVYYVRGELTDWQRGRRGDDE